MTTSPSIDQLSRIASCIDAIGTDRFPQLLGDLCQDLCEADNVYMTALFDGLSPVVLYGNHARSRQHDLLAEYLEAAYLLDPIYLHFGHSLGDAALALAEVAPDDFLQSEYYAKFFKEMGLRDECAVLLHLSDTAGVFISLGFERPDAQADPVHLQAMLPVIAALARRHWATLTPENTTGTGRMLAHLNAALVSFGASVLSPREHDITLLILQGHSSKAIARALGNSPETVKVHRKRIYAKLGVSGQADLMSLFLEALRHMPAGAEGDPITYLSR